MLENQAPTDKFGVLYCLLHIKFHGFNYLAGSLFQGYHTLDPGINSNYFTDEWVP